MMPVKADLAIIALPLVCLDSAGVWLSCQAIIWFQFLRDCSGFLQIRSQLSVIVLSTARSGLESGVYGLALAQVGVRG